MLTSGCSLDNLAFGRARKIGSSLFHQVLSRPSRSLIVLRILATGVEDDFAITSFLFTKEDICACLTALLKNSKFAFVPGRTRVGSIISTSESLIPCSSISMANGFSFSMCTHRWTSRTGGENLVKKVDATPQPFASLMFFDWDSASITKSDVETF